MFQIQRIWKTMVTWFYIYVHSLMKAVEDAKNDLYSAGFYIIRKVFNKLHLKFVCSTGAFLLGCSSGVVACSFAYGPLIACPLLILGMQMQFYLWLTWKETASEKLVKTEIEKKGKRKKVRLKK